MIWTSQTQGNLFAEWNFGDGIWSMQSNVIRLRVSGVVSSVLVELLIGGETIKYYTDATGALKINLSDYFRALSIGDSVAFSVKYDADEISITAIAVGLINPLSQIIPPLQMGLDSLLIAPPKMWLVPLFGLDDSVEFYRLASAAGYTYYGFKRGGYYSYPLVNGLQSISFRSNDAMIYIEETDSVVVKQLERLPLICGRRYAAVEWISRSGMTKRHTWEVVRVSDGVNGMTEYQTPLGYEYTKGQETTLVLRLSGLTRYDYWYYSDIITSNDVRVAINEQDADFGDETRVSIVTNKVTIPDANGTYKIEVEIKYKRYDEF